MEPDLENLELFLVECEESLELLESGLLKLEEKGANPEEIDSVFRAAHTIKGGARLMGFGNIEKLAHSMEEVLEKVRSQTLDLNAAIISLLLKSEDALRTGTAYLQENQKESDVLFDQLTAELTACSNGEMIVEEEVPESEETEKVEEVVAEVVEEVPEEDWGNESDWEENSEQEKIEEKESVAISPVKSKQNSEIPLTTNAPPVTKARVRIDVESLDKIMNLVGELVLCRNQLIQISHDEKNPALQTAVGTISSITSELQERVMNTRMLQVGTLFTRYHRMVRDMSKGLGKKINLVIGNEETELDRNMLEALKDPVSHLINNAMDHGLEKPEERKNNNKQTDGTIVLNSYHEGGQVVIEVRDDGRGFNLDKIKQRLIEREIYTEEELSKMKEEEIQQTVFQAGFSTLDEATLLSGRGVGLDVVKSNIMSIGGQVTVKSVMGEGSTFKLHIPLTLAVLPAITVEVNRQIFAIPQTNLQELIYLDNHNINKIERIDDLETYRLRGQLLPIIRLRELIDCEPEDRDRYYILVLISGDQRFGLLVDDIRDIEEIVVKPLSGHFKEIEMFLGATLLGDGELALILDVVGVGARRNVRPNEGNVKADSTVFRTKTASTALLFDLGGVETFAVQMSEVLRLEEINKNIIEYSGNRQVIQYRGQIMPIIDIDEFIDVDSDMNDQEMINLVVFLYRGREVALKVKRIVDSVNFEGELNTQVVEDPLLLGTMMINNEPFLLIDAIRIFDMAFRPKIPKLDNKVTYKVLYVDDSSFFLKVVAKYLLEAGYNITTEISSPKAFELAMSEEYDLFLVDLEMPEIDGFEFIEKLKETEHLKNIPVLVLSAITSDRDRELALELGADGYLVKIDKEELLSRVEQLIQKEVMAV